MNQKTPSGISVSFDGVLFTVKGIKPESNDGLKSGTSYTRGRKWKKTQKNNGQKAIEAKKVTGDDLRRD
jgi:hypothetical protein